MTKIEILKIKLMGSFFLFVVYCPRIPHLSKNLATAGIHSYIIPMMKNFHCVTFYDEGSLI